MPRFSAASPSPLGFLKNLLRSPAEVFFKKDLPPKRFTLKEKLSLFFFFFFFFSLLKIFYVEVQANRK
jgi:hypothetical protein